MKPLLSLLALLTLSALPRAQAPSFLKGGLSGATPSDPTSLDWGPDGRLYVAERFGRIRAYTVERLSAGNYSVLATETLDQVRNKPNRSDTGALEPAVTQRQCTGILVEGTALAPVIYVTSSDPRVAVGVDSGLDTNSGLLTRLSWNGSSWDELDLVRGLPRCEENHASNGMALDAATNTLYLAQGGNTNMGAPSNNFGQTPEYALSAAVLSIDLDQIGDTTYDLPTLDDPSRPNTGPGGADENDPFGGNDGANQAMWVAGGPVQVYASGLRNPYDVLIHSQGWIFSVDNGPNSGWGGPPPNCDNTSNESGSQHYPDALHRIGSLGDSGGYYAGHPNPFRASSQVTVNGQSPLSPGLENAAECAYGIPGPSNGALKVWYTSTNGLCEYTASSFGGSMLGDVLVVGYGSRRIERVQLAPDGSFVSSTPLLSQVGISPLDLVVRGDGDSFAGTIWVASFGSDSITVYEPEDMVLCTGADSAALDEDGDGFTNADEIDNGTNPCSSGDVPPDLDGDLVSDLNDPDDDGDGIPDVSDRFARDASNGAGLSFPFHYGWGVGDPGVGLFGMGFTGLMSNGSADYLDQFTSTDVIAGGAAGKFTIDHVDASSALGAQNDQRNAFQLGLTLGGGQAFVARTTLEAPYFGGLAPVPGQAQGFFLGDGGQDDFVALALTAGGFEFALEDGGVVQEQTLLPASELGALSIELSLEVDPIAGTVQPGYRADGGALVHVGGPRSLPPALAPALAGSEALALGLIASAGPNGPSFAATWGELEVAEAATPPPVVLYRVNCGGPQVGSLDGGVAWSEDSQASPSSFVNAGSQSQAQSGLAATPHSSAPAEAPLALYASERIDGAAGEEMQWEFPVEAGSSVEVRLYFAESAAAVNGVGQRVFDVFVEGQLIDDVDPFGEAGFDVGFVRSAVVQVDDGVLDVDFVRDQQDPSIRAIEVRVPGTLVASRTLLSVSAGGSQQLYLNAGVEHMGALYIVLSGSSGSSPGTPVGNVHLPLNYDALALFSLQAAGQPPFLNSVGLMDVFGRAQSTFVLPPNLSASIAGLEITHAGLLLQGANAVFVSQPVRLVLTP